MKKMYSEEQLAEIAGGQLDPSEIPSGGIVDDGIVGINKDNELVKGSLFGKFVRIIEPPASTTLTEEELELFKNGVFVNGEFLTLKNAVFFPATVTSSYASGSIFGLVESGAGLKVYFIDANRNIALIASVIDYDVFATGLTDLTINTTRDLLLRATRDLYIQSFSFPKPPANDGKNYRLVCQNKFGYWAEGSGLYKHTIVFNTDYEIQLISSNATAVDSLSALATLLKDAKTTQILYVDNTNDECVFAPYGHTQNNASYDDQANEINLDFHFPAYDDKSGTKMSIQYRGLVISAPDGVTIADSVAPF